MKKVRARLTYANVMSTIAVFLLLGGAGAVAATKTLKIGTRQLKGSAVTAAKIKNGAVLNSKLAAGAVTGDKIADGAVGNSKLTGNAVTTGNLANDSVTGDKVAEATLGEVPSANSANPAVFAKVAANGVLDGGNSKGLTSLNVSHGLGTGIYCISVPSFSPRGAQVTPQVVGVAPVTAQASISGPNCAGGTVQVSTFFGAGATDEPFFLTIYR
jgi:hypothetical protein